MGRKGNPVETVQIQVSLARPVYELLEAIAKSGYGARTSASVAEEMIRAGLNTLKTDDFLSARIKKRIDRKV